MNNINLLVASCHLQTNKIDFKLVDALPSVAISVKQEDKGGGKRTLKKVGKKGR